VKAAGWGGLLGKKRKIKRTWLEISALTNAHILQMLPYKAMLGHVAKLADERDKLIGEILAAKERERESEIEDHESEGATVTTRSTPRSSISFHSSLSESDEGKARGRDEAVQTEESSFDNEH